VWKGRTAIEEGHAAVHKTVFRNSVQRERLEELTFVGPDAAVVRFYSTLTGDERSPDKVIRSRKVLILTKRDGIWKVGWGQNTGNRQMRRVLNQAANAAVKAKGTIVAIVYRRLVPRLGHAQAIGAIGDAIVDDEQRVYYRPATGCRACALLLPVPRSC
jgi:hypothetical protein